MSRIPLARLLRSHHWFVVDYLPFCPWLQLALPRQNFLDLLEFHIKWYRRLRGQRPHGDQ